MKDDPVVTQSMLKQELKVTQSILRQELKQGFVEFGRVLREELKQALREQEVRLRRYTDEVAQEILNAVGTEFQETNSKIDHLDFKIDALTAVVQKNQRQLFISGQAPTSDTN
jgi:hypothetical protein